MSDENLNIEVQPHLITMVEDCESTSWNILASFQYRIYLHRLVTRGEKLLTQFRLCTNYRNSSSWRMIRLFAFFNKGIIKRTLSSTLKFVKNGLSTLSYIKQIYEHKDSNDSPIFKSIKILRNLNIPLEIAKKFCITC